MYRVHLQECLVADDGRRMLCRFTAPDAESVRVALRQAGIAFDSVWIAQPIARAAACFPSSASDPSSQRT
jgi:hypothetical protein